MINNLIALHLMNITSCTNSFHLSVLTVDYSLTQTTKTRTLSHIQIPARWNELHSQNAVQRHVPSVNFYAIFVAFICDLCCKAASCQLFNVFVENFTFYAALYLYECWCHGLRLPDLNKETTYLLTYLLTYLINEYSILFYYKVV